MAQNQIIYVFLLSVQLGWTEIVSPGNEILISSIFFPTFSSSDLHHETNFHPPGQGVL